jgi:hypothetical protein
MSISANFRVGARSIVYYSNVFLEIRQGLAMSRYRYRTRRRDNELRIFARMASLTPHRLLVLSPFKPYSIFLNTERTRRNTSTVTILPVHS